MDGLAAISSRIAEITGQLGQLSAPPLPLGSAPAATATAARRSSATGTGATAGTTTSAASFADVLATAVQANPGGTTLGTSSTTSTTARPARTPAVDAATTATATPAPSTVDRPTGTGRPSTPGRLTASGAPADLARYGNGRIPASALESIGGGHRLWAPAADAFDRLRAAAHRAGVSIGVTDSYRSYAEQVDVARRKGLHSQGGLAARPGTSEHGWGKSLDLRLDSAALRWMRHHADDDGFTENVSREPWHWTYAAR
jgi:hypothetical protein